MAASLSLLLSLLILGTLSAQELASEHVLPHLTSCVSNDMETFRCSWNVGTFQNLSQPGDLRLFYIKKNLQSLRECPQYGPPGTSECYFSENHTSIWIYYSVQLFSRDRAVLYDERIFPIEEIVQPHPPVELNWTLLTVAPSGTHFDVRLSWKAPQTADVKTGWMRLEYEVQHREGAADAWKSKDLQRNTVTSLYGLQTNVDHEVRVRSRMLSFKEFGAFSDSLFIRVASQENSASYTFWEKNNEVSAVKPVSKVQLWQGDGVDVVGCDFYTRTFEWSFSRFPIAILLIFAALCFLGVLMLVMQQRLMVILLPRVPGPKIRGFDPELLKNGKLSELMSALGTHDQLKSTNNDQSDPWVEFIDLDIEEEEEEEEEGSCGPGDAGSPSSPRAPLSSLGLRDDSDSGRDSCCCCDGPSDHGRSPSCEPPAPRSPARDPSAWPTRERAGPVGLPPADLYTLVSHVHGSGEVLLKAGEEEAQRKEEEEEEEEKHKQEEEEEEEEEKENAKIDFRLVMTADAEEAETWGYSSERDAGKTTVGEPSVPPSALPSWGCQGCPQGAYTAAQPLSYTLVEGVDKQNSLLLGPNNTPVAWLCTPKSVPTPEGYLTPDLLRDITP